MPLGMEVGLDQGHTVLDEEDPAPSTERDTYPHFRNLRRVATI